MHRFGCVACSPLQTHAHTCVSAHAGGCLGVAPQDHSPPLDLEPAVSGPSSRSPRPARHALGCREQSPEQSLEDVAPLAGVVLPVAQGRQSGVGVVEFPPGENEPWAQALQFAPPWPGTHSATCGGGRGGGGV